MHVREGKLRRYLTLSSRVQVVYSLAEVVAAGGLAQVRCMCRSHFLIEPEAE